MHCMNVFVNGWMASNVKLIEWSSRLENQISIQTIYHFVKIWRVIEVFP